MNSSTDTISGCAGRRERTIDVNDCAALYYNRVNGVSAQMALILAAIRSDDGTTTRARAATGGALVLFHQRTVDRLDTVVAR